MNGIIVATHGDFAQGLYSTIKMIAGEFNNIEIVQFQENDTMESVDQRLIDAYKNFSKYKNVLVLSDLAGGTPFNRAVMNLSEYENVRFLAGMNFAMLYQALSSDEENIDKLVDEIIETSVSSIQVYKNEKNDEKETFEDGI